MHPTQMAKRNLIIAVCLMTYIFIGTPTFSSENIWIKFNTDPNYKTFELCLSEIHQSITGGYLPLQSPTYQSLSKPEAFTYFLKLIETGNSFAIKLGFEVMPIALSNASVSEELIDSLAKVIKIFPEEFLIPFEAFKAKESEIASHILVRTDETYVDNYKAQNKEMDLRIKAIERVKDPKLADIQDYSVKQLVKHKAFIQSAIAD